MNYLKFCQKCKENGKPLSTPGYHNIFKQEAYECGFCKGKLIDTIITSDEFSIIFKTSKDVNFLESMIKLKEDDIIEYQSRISQFKTQLQQQESSKPAQTQSNESDKVTCPRCGSTNIADGTRGFSIITGFIGSGSFRYVCRKCNNKWKPGSILELAQRANNKHW